MKYTLFILTLILAAAVLPTELLAQLDQGAAVSSLEHQLVRGMTDSAIVIVRHEYNLMSNTQEYVRGDRDHFGSAYSLGVYSEGRIWVQDDALRPWESDDIYQPYANRDTLRPILKNTYIRPLCDSTFRQISVSQVDTFPGPTSGLAVAGFPCEMSSAKQQEELVGWAVVVHPECRLDSSETCPVKVNVLHNRAKIDPATGEIVLSSGTAVLNALGGAFFVSNIQTGQMKLEFVGLLKKKLLRFQVLPIPTVEGFNLMERGVDIPPSPPQNNTQGNGLRPLDGQQEDSPREEDRRGSRRGRGN